MKEIKIKNKKHRYLLNIIFKFKISFMNRI
jgi:hypothetical protein